jgi:1-acyl-sn-glycerol-3-phosphate acyltransferase
VSTHEIDRALGRLLCAFARALTGARARWLGSAPAATQRVYFANHNSHGDFVLLWASLPADLRERTRPVAGADYWNKGALRRYVAQRVLRAVLIDRDPATRTQDPIEQMAHVLDRRRLADRLSPRARATRPTRRCCRSRAGSTTSPCVVPTSSWCRSGSTTRAASCPRAP